MVEVACGLDLSIHSPGLAGTLLCGRAGSNELERARFEPILRDAAELRLRSCCVRERRASGRRSTPRDFWLGA